MAPKSLIAVLAAAGLMLAPLPLAAAEKLKVIASFSIIGDMARRVGGERIDLRVLVGPNGDAHVYEPRPSDAMAMAAADVVLVNGLKLEGFLGRLIKASGAEAPVIELTRNASIIRDPEGGHYHHYEGRSVFHEAPFDPHAWQSLANAQVYVANIADAFCEADAAGCETYKSNAAAYREELAALDGDIRQAMAAIPEERRLAVVAHNAFRYFERDYGVRFLAPTGVSTDSEASAADVAGVLRDMREKRAVAVFTENIADSRLVARIAADAGLTLAGTLYSDALSGPDGPAPSYIDMMRHNLRTITRALAPD
ncbi:ABC transporter substrate-binding protein [Agaricicola taiwanensis]|uniref:ABC transporter substrate-binding protein n=1 Tax=Agaricicola taiwanensis TaxID=591372 RepID=A0A8J3DXP9_9RHOB|nr:zinc ABC transporter substrate-binding protein AztC [Agaricicola taiwanensis]GGE51967.1 ABC transporter substrate-binding protein [Agaricicola taiwanensis]